MEAEEGQEQGGSEGLEGEDGGRGEVGEDNVRRKKTPNGRGPIGKAEDRERH